VGFKRRRGKKDDYEAKAAKRKGKLAQWYPQADSQGSADDEKEEKLCQDGGKPGHNSKRSKKCDHNKTKDKIIEDALGDHYEVYTRKVYLSSVLRPKYKGDFERRVIRLSDFIRNVVTRSQIFVNAYVIENWDSYNHDYIFQQNFWYSVCQLIMDVKVTNKSTPLTPSISEAFEKFKLAHPNILYPMAYHKITGYSDSLSTAYSLLETIYKNHVIENFEGRLLRHFYNNLKPLFPISL
jgi:hypothetical protein